MNTRQFRFGENEVNSSTRTLLRGGRSLSVEPKVFDVLVLLLTHRDRVVTKHELLDSVWGRQVVTDGVVTRTVMKARRLIGDFGDNTRSVRALQRIGFRRLPVRRRSDQEAVHYMALVAPGAEVDLMQVLIDYHVREEQSTDFEHDEQVTAPDGMAP